MKFKVHRSTRHGVTVAHNRTSLRCWVVRATALSSVTIVNGATRPSAPVRVIGSKIVTELMRNHIEVPAVVVQVVGQRGVQVGRESRRIIGAANNVEVGDASCARIRPAGHEVDQVAGPIGQVGVVQPFHSKCIQHGSGIANEGCVWVSCFPHIHVRGRQIDEVVQLCLINFGNTCEQGKRPFNGVSAVLVEGVVGIKIDVNCDFNARRYTGSLAMRCRRMSVFSGFEPAFHFLHSTIEGRGIEGIGYGIQHGIACVNSFAFQAANLVLYPLVPHRTCNFVCHNYECPMKSCAGKSVGKQLGRIAFDTEPCLGHVSNFQILGMRLKSVHFHPLVRTIR